MTELQRVTTIRPAYDCIRNQPCKFGSDKCKPGFGGSHGVHNAELHMLVRGPSAEVMLVISTGWQLPSVPERSRNILRYPSGSYVEFHTAAPQYTDHNPSIRVAVDADAACKSWDNCYFDRGYLAAEAPATLLVTNGSDAVWAWLEAEHDRIVTQTLTFKS